MFASDLKLFNLPTASLPATPSALKAAYTRKIASIKASASADSNEALGKCQEASIAYTRLAKAIEKKAAAAASATKA
eukprot:CAMPEP_0197568796 /NCGR_PEP_ID=MMETSP1320-20131121/37920_1 /TAXON_ID=91990 /ORGANISM="Bolidomonas sp., Strain RCC2347" /LENGTH=76 /DNA_ID=CAMNT_0043131093 /DNA_START=251 /DNA_END=478 /DNA_ORIENTATION=+